MTTLTRESADEIKRLRTALEPLAKRGDNRGSLPDDWEISIPLSELRAARKALDR